MIINHKMCFRLNVFVFLHWELFNLGFYPRDNWWQVLNINWQRDTLKVTNTERIRLSRSLKGTICTMKNIIKDIFLSFLGFAYVSIFYLHCFGSSNVVTVFFCLFCTFCQLLEFWELLRSSCHSYVLYVHRSVASYFTVPVQPNKPRPFFVTRKVPTNWYLWYKTYNYWLKRNLI